MDFRDKVELYDKLKIAMTATGGTFLVTGPIMWGAAPSKSKYEDSIKALEAEIAAIGAQEKMYE